MIKNKRVTYKHKIFVVIFFNMLVLYMIVGVTNFYVNKSILKDSLVIQAVGIAETIKLLCTNALLTQDNVFLYDFNSNFISQKKEIENIIISTKSGNFFIFKKDSWEYKNELDNFFRNRQLKSNYVDFIYSPILNKNVFYLSYPIFLSEVNWGWLHISINIEQYKEKLDSLFMNALLGFAIVLIISLLISHVIANIYSEPIRNLNEIAKEINKYKFNQKINIFRNDEIGDLANTFNQMISHIFKSKEELILVNKSLEEKVFKRTNTLNELNQNLDKRIKEEISKREEQEKLFLQQSRLATMSEMINMIAHQWRQPLTSLGLLIQNLQILYSINKNNELNFNEIVTRSLKLIDQMSQTINDFSNFFRPRKILKVVKIKKSIENLYYLLEDSFKYYQIDVVIEENNTELFCYENELLQVIVNILNNAKDALIERKIKKPYIKIYFEEKENDFLISIEDNAGGISAEIKDRIFDPYFSTKNEKNGSGIGLYMAKIIIEENMKGNLYFNNIKDGTIFIIELNKLYHTKENNV